MPIPAKCTMLAGALLLPLGCVTTSAGADETGNVYVAPGPSTLLSPDVLKRYQDQPGVTTRKLGDLLGGSLVSPTRSITDVLVMVGCGHYKTATITYADGSAKTMNLGNAPATKNDMAQAKAAIPTLRIVDLAGCDD